MTLLSIREQEAVREALYAFANVARDIGRRAPTLSFGEANVIQAEAERVLVSALTLATRDAIARQVRERTKEFEARGIHQYLATEAATFIEGLGVDR